VLLAVTGLSPQVVTETVYALWRRDPELVPTEIHLITTARGAEHARLNLGSAQHRPLVEGRARFSDCVSAVQEVLAEHELVIDLRGRRIRAGGRTVRLPPTELAFLSWFARRAKNGQAPLPGITEKDMEGRGSAYREQFAAELRRIDPLLDEDGKTLRAFGLRDGMLRSYFNTKNSKLNAALREKLGALAARPYLILQENDGSGYALVLPPAAIRYASVPAPRQDTATQACETGAAV
jgi:hypothetical protein